MSVKRWSSDAASQNPEPQTTIFGKLPPERFEESHGVEFQLAERGGADDPTVAMPSELSTHSGIIGDFRILKEIGRGGMGVVYEAIQQSLERRVALKILPLAGRLDQRQIQRFQNEARAAAHLSHPNIVPVYAVGSEAGNHFYAMQLIEGHDLAHFIRQAKNLVDSKVVRRSAETPPIMNHATLKDNLNNVASAEVDSASSRHDSSSVSFPSADFVDMMSNMKSSVAAKNVIRSMVQIGIQAADALYHAHQMGIVHRDIKPSNLLLDNTGKVWIADFGLAQVQGAGSLTMTGDVIGTLRYMSPEQPLGHRVLVDQRTDIYSLGVTLYELLTLKRVHNGTAPKEIIRQVCFDDPAGIRRLNPRIPVELETVILKAISKSPNDRYQTAQEFADDLRRFLNDQPILARRPTLAQQTQRWIRRHAAIATAIAFAGLIVCITSVVASGMIWNSLTAETQQRKRAESLLKESEGMRMSLHSALEKDVNPGLALLLATRGAQLNPGVDANSTLLTAMGLNHEVRTFSPRTGISGTLAVSPDGSKVVTTNFASTGGMDKFPAIESDIETGLTLRTFDDGNAITSAAYSPDGHLLLLNARQVSDSKSTGTDTSSSTDSDPVAVTTLWDPRSGDKRFSFDNTGILAVSMMSFSPESDRLVLPGPENSVRVYSTRDGKLLSSLKGHTSPVFLTAFHPNGRQVASVAADKTVRVWDLVSSSELKEFPLEMDSQESVHLQFSEESGHLLVSTDAGTRLLAVDNGPQIEATNWPESAFTFSNDGQSVALYDKFDTQVTIRNLRSLARTTIIKTPDRILSADLSNDGVLLLVTTIKEALIFRTVDGTLTTSLKGHTNRLIEGTFIPGGERVVTSSHDATVRCWNISDGNTRQRLLGETAATWSISRDSVNAVVVAEPLWQTELRNADGSSSTSSVSGFVPEDSNPDTDRLLTTDEHHVFITHAPSSRQIAVFNAASDRLLDAKPMTGTDTIAVLLESGAVVLWNITTDQRIAIGDPQEKVHAMDVHPASGRMALAQGNGDCVVYDVQSRGIVHAFSHEHQSVYVRFDKTGSRLLTVDSENATRLWSLDKDQTLPLQTLHLPDSKCDRAAFSGDESAILTWSALETSGVHCWETDSGKLLGETAPVETPHVKCHPTLPLVAVSSTTNGLFLWDWVAGNVNQLTTVAARSPIFVENRLVTIEADAEFVLGEPMAFSYGDQTPFARAAVVTRDLTSGNILSTQTQAVEPHRLTIDTNSGQILYSVRTYSAEVIRMDDHQKTSTVGRHAGPLTFAEVAGTGNDVRFVCASMDGTASISDQAGKVLHRLAGFPSPIVSAAVSADGLRLAAFHASGEGSLWNVADGKRISEFHGHSKPVHSVRFSASGTKLLTAAADSVLLIRDLISRTEKSFTFDSRVLTHAEWSPDEKRVLVVSGSGQERQAVSGEQNKTSGAILLEVETEKQVSLPVEGSAKFGIISPDGAWIIVVSDNGTATLFNADREETLPGFNVNRRPIYLAAFSPDSRDLLVRHDGELSLWELQTGIEIMRVPEADRRHWGVVMPTFFDWQPFTPDGQWILSLTPSLQKWPRDPLPEAVRQLPRPMTPSEQQRFSIDMLTTRTSVKEPRND